VAGNIASRRIAVYVLRDPLTGARYVGSTTMLTTRLRAHNEVEHRGWHRYS